MQRFWNSLLVSPALFCAILVGGAAVASEIPITEAEEIPSVNAMAQVTSVSQLSDVQPTDWAFQALQSLVERYGCIAGYPNGTFRGNRAMTRYEFAAGLNACLNRVGELISTATDGFANKQDIARIQKLEEQFAPELATLRGRVDALEAKTADLEAHQFSATTKLNAEVVVAVTSVFAGQNSNGGKIDRNPILADRVRLNFESSFTGKDLLRTRLQATNQDAFSGNSTFTPEGDLRFAGGAFGTGSNNSVVLDQLLYQFPLGKNTMVVIDANAGAADDFTDVVNPYLYGDGGSGAFSHFGDRSPIYYLANGTGLGIKHQFSKNLELSLGYLGNNATSPSNGSGLLNGAYGAIAQLTVKPSDQFTVGLTYVNSYNNDYTANGSVGSNRANLRSALANNPNLPDALSPLAGANVPVSSNSYGIQASLQLSPKFVIGGWAGYTNTRTLSAVSVDDLTIPRGELDIWNYAVTLAFPDLGKKGNIGGIIVGMEPKVTGISTELGNVIGKDKDTSLHIEGFYQYKLSDNISITPGVIWLTAPDHNNDNKDVVIGAVRTTFTF